MTARPDTATLDDVLTEVIATCEHPTREALLAIVHRYPEHERALVDFFTTWTEQEILPASPAPSKEREDAIVNRAMSHVQNLLYAREKAGSFRPVEHSRSAADGPQFSPGSPQITSIFAQARKVGMSPHDLELACDLDAGILAKLERRIIEFSSIPRRLIEMLANRISTAVEAVVNFLDSADNIVESRSFLSKGKLRSSQKETFAAAIERSTLSDQQKERWRAEIAAMK